ncbi:MAG TPA: xanthine dehydrogenase family protein molybdopterin-binding subunit [Ktedonobacterales bacterium]|nr:xanthine dehydrogenase family protein molybdopterin-binding subunit [Ktedonobacterales bacterium]
MSIRIVTTHTEFEGRVYEQRVVMEGEEPPVWGPDAELAVVGTPQPRVDAQERVTGAADYAYDMQPAGLLTAAGLRSPHAHARITRLDTTAAEAAPGVRAVFSRNNAADFQNPNRDATIFADELLYQGALVAVVVAESREQANDALRLIHVEYEPLPFVVDPDQALGTGPLAATTKASNILEEYPKTYERGDVDAGMASADEIVEVHVETPACLHNSMETHGATAEWDGRMLTIWSSTQDLFGVRRQVATALGLRQNQVRAVKQYMGGGFGSKFGAHDSGLLAAYAAHRLGAPVKYMLTREEENLCAGYRSPSIQTFRAGAKRDGTLTALDQRSVASIGQGAWMPPVAMATKEMYLCPNVRAVDVAVQTNLGPFASFRAPGAVEGTVGLEITLDRLANALGMDPLAFRRQNYAAEHQDLNRPYARKLVLEAYEQGAEAIGWGTRNLDVRRYPNGKGGMLRRGVGMASQMWGGDGGPPAQASAKLLPDGTAVILTGTQDIGTGTRTVLAQIAADELSLPLDHIRVELGDTEFGLYSPPSGGSVTLSSVGPAVRMAATEARKQALEVIAHLTEAPTDAIELRGGTAYNRETGKELGTLASFLEQLDGHEISGKGMRGPNAENMTVRTFGAQFAEVEVDIGTGQVRVVRVVACHDCGRIVNPLTFSSQIEGGIIQGLGMALMEQRIVDERFGTVMNANLEDYTVPTIRDIPQIDIILLDSPVVQANTIGTLGAGEPPIIPAPAAIANAVAHAISRPVSALPLTPARILDLLREPAQ